MMMKMGRTSRPHTPPYAMWFGERGVHRVNQLPCKCRPPAWQLFALVDIGEGEPKTLEEINPHWRAQWWSQVAAQGITDEEVPWHELVTPLTSGAEGMARSLSKCLVTAWEWNICKVVLSSSLVGSELLFLLGNCGCVRVHKFFVRVLRSSRVIFVFHRNCPHNVNNTNMFSCVGS